MATRMTTLLYGEKPGCDVAPGNRADTADAAVPAPAPPFLTSPSFAPPPRSTTTQPLAATPVRPLYPTPHPDPWLARRAAASFAEKNVALPAIMFGIAAAAAVFAGLAVVAVALAWSHSMTLLAQVALMVVGGYLISVGVGYVVSESAEQRLSHAHAYG